MLQLATSYSISGAAVTITGVNVPLNQILLVADATTGNVLYSVAGPAPVSYTQGANSVITLATTPSNTDKLTIKYDDGVATSNAPSTVTLGGSNITVPVSLNGGRGSNATLPNYDSIVGGTVSLGSAVSIAGGQSVSLSGGTVTLGGAVSLASGQSLASAGYVSIPAAFVTGQAKIAVTGTAVQLGSNALTQGVLISALSTNTASITIGTSSSVTNVVNGTGNGAILTAGSTKSIAATNTNLIWINGTAGDIISFIGS
jgi:hypothetical protein